MGLRLMWLFNVRYFMMLSNNRLHYSKAVLFVALSIATLAILFLAVSTEILRLFIRNTGYWFLLGLSVWFAYITYQIFKKHVVVNWKLNRWGLLLCLFGSIFIHVHERHAYKILEDEAVLGATAQYMHRHHKITTPYQAHIIDNRQVLMDDYPNKRPPFFSFTVSLVHTLSGYRPENAYVVNGLTGALMLLLLYGLGTQIGDSRYGILAVLLMLGLPLFPHLATSAGFDLLNTLFILLMLWAAGLYWKDPGELEETFLVLCGVLLANIRYESIAYMVFVGLIVLWKQLSLKQLKLSWAFVLCPLLLFTALANIVFFQRNPFFFETQNGASGFWGTQYILKNISGDLYYLFNTDGKLTNSAILSVMGCLLYTSPSPRDS